MAADIRVMSRQQNKGQRIEAIDHVAPTAPTLARLGDSAFTGDLSLLGSRTSREGNVSPFSNDYGAVLSTRWAPLGTPLSCQNNGTNPSPNRKERSFLSTFADRTVRGDRSSGAEILNSTQEGKEISLGRSQTRNLESENGLGHDYSNALLSLKKRSSARRVDLQHSNHQSGYQKAGSRQRQLLLLRLNRP